MKKNILFSLQKIATLTLFSALLFFFLGFGSVAFAANIAPSSSKKAITDLQKALQAQGYYICGTLCTVDGIFGTNTTNAVKALQSHNGLSQTGVVDDATAGFLGLSLSDYDNPNGSGGKSCAYEGDGTCAATESCVNYFCVAKTAGSGSGGGTGKGLSCPPNNPLCVPDSPYDKGSLAGADTVMDLVGKVLKYLLFFAGIVAVVAMVIGGYQYIAARGNEEMVEQGQKTLTNAIIGLVVVIMAYTIVNLLVKSLTGDPTKTSYIQKIKIV